jgi:hypothetical protein
MDAQGNMVNPNGHSYQPNVGYIIDVIDNTDSTAKVRHPDTGQIGNWIHLTSIEAMISPDWDLLKKAMSPDEVSILELTDFPTTVVIPTDSKSQVVMKQADSLALLLAASDILKQKATESLPETPTFDASNMFDN